MEQSATDLASVSIPGNAELHSHVKSHQQQQQLVIVQQDEMLDNISAAASRIGQMGLQMNQELKVRAHSRPTFLHDATPHLHVFTYLYVLLFLFYSALVL